MDEAHAQDRQAGVAGSTAAADGIPSVEPIAVPSAATPGALPARGERVGTTERILVEEPFLARLARRLTRKDADAEDLVQETMLRAYRARDRFETGTSMRAWLATILRRLFVTASLKETRRRTHADSDLGEPIAFRSVEPISHEVAAGAGHDAALEHVDDRVRRALGKLPDTYREPFVLFALDGLSYAEIASHLAIPVGTVMSRIHRARTRLKDERLSTTTADLGA